MAIVFSCACGKRYSVDESQAGRPRQCKKCGADLVVPRAEDGDEEKGTKTHRTRKSRAEAEKKRRRTIVISSLAVGGVVVAAGLIILVIALAPGKRGGRAGQGEGGQPAEDGAAATVTQGGYAVVDTLGDAAQVKGDVATEQQRQQLVRKLAQEAPPFDPGRVPTMRSTLGSLVSRSDTSEEWIEMCDKWSRGEPLPQNADSRYMDRQLRGQKLPAKTATAEAKKEAWQPIPIDKPATPFKLGLATGIPLEAHAGGPFHPGVMNGPFFVPFPWWLHFRPPTRAFDLSRDPANRLRYVAKVINPRPPHPIIDVRDGKTVSEFDWRAPVWANPRLSPDGSFMVGTDTYATLEMLLSSTIAGWENGKDTLYIWPKGKTKAPATLKVPGPVDWMEFVAGDQLAYVTYTPKTVVRIHDVAKNQQLGEIEMPDVKPLGQPERKHDETPVFPGLEFYRPMARRGAVSAGGKYIALGCQDGVRLLSVPERKVIGLLPINAKAYRWLNFSADGSRLFGFVIANTPHGEICYLRSWSVVNGMPLDEMTVESEITGPIFAGPIEGLYLASKFLFTKSHLPLDNAPFRIVRLDDEGQALVIGPRSKAPPDTPPPQSVTEKNKTKQTGREPDRMDVPHALFQIKLDWSAAVKKAEPVVALIAERPAARSCDRSGIVLQKSEPPASWTPPSFSPAPTPAPEPDDPAAMHQFAAWPLSFGDDKAALVRYVPNEQHRKRWEVWLDLLDRTTGKRAAPAVKLWDWAHYPDEMSRPTDASGMPPRPLPAIGAVRGDAGLFALVDPDDARRVDVFKPTGEHVLGLLPSERRVDWLGWTRTHLVTVAGGRLAAWDPSSGKAAFEVDGGYTHVGEVAPDSQWVVLWTGKHADVLDASTGKCLGRCQAGGFDGRLQAFTLSPDGKHLAAAFTGWPKPLPGTGPGNTAVVWNLETGKAGLYGFPGDSGRRSRLITPPTCAWVGTEHLLLCGRTLTEPATLLDVRLALPVGSYKIQGGGYNVEQPAVASPDGRLWFPTSAIAGVPKNFNARLANHPDFPAQFAWHTASLPGLHGKDAFLADAAREWVDLASQPVRVEVKVGSDAQNDALARSIARAVQTQGFRIGAGGTVLRVKGTVEETQDTIQFLFGAEAKIPRCALSGRWLSAEKNELWKGQTSWKWSMAGSKYKVSEKSEPVGNPMYSARRYEFNFQGQNPSAAMRDELLDNQAMASNWFQLPNKQFLRAGGQDRQLPVTDTMGTRLPPAAK
jgi:hypothetical protein